MPVKKAKASTSSDATLRMLQESIFDLCQNVLPFKAELCVEGLLGITLDNENIVLVNIRESFRKDQSENEESDRKGLQTRTRSRRRGMSAHTKVLEEGSEPTQDISIRTGQVDKVVDDVGHEQTRNSINTSQLETLEESATGTGPSSGTIEPSDISPSEFSGIMADSGNVVYIMTQSAADQVQLELVEGMEIKEEQHLFVMEQDAIGEQQPQVTPDSAGEDPPRMKVSGLSDEKIDDDQQAVGEKDATSRQKSGAGESEERTNQGEVNPEDDESVTNDDVRRAIKKHQCPHCDKVFNRKNNLTNHLKVHRDLKPGCSCDTCGKLFAKRNQLKKHAATHSVTRSRQLSCEHCGKTFFWERDRKRHLKRHTLTPNHLCGVCGKGFYEEHRLQRHQRTHGVGQLICDQCGKGFRDAHSLKIHVDSHKGIYLYQCTMCKQGYAEKRRLVEHLKSHKKRGQRPFLCQICQKGFAHSKSLVVHLKTKH